jgi:hypothetical protein
MLVLNLKRLSLLEAIQLNKVEDPQTNVKFIIATSDDPNPKAARDETFKVKDILKDNGGTYNGSTNYWYWDDRIEPISLVLPRAVKAIELANKYLKQTQSKKFSDFYTLEQLNDIKNFLEGIREAAALLKTKNVVFELIDKYIDELADSLEDGKILNDIAEFNKLYRRYITSTGRWNYSPRNMFLIYLQTLGKKGVTDFGPKEYWRGKGYRPKENAQRIVISVRVDKRKLKDKVDNILKNNPNAAKEFSKESGIELKDGKYVPFEKHYAFYTWGFKKGYDANVPKNTSFFTNGFVYDNTDVEPIPGETQTDPPEGLEWYSKDDTEDFKTFHIFNALVAFTKKYNINVSKSDELGRARGVSTGGHIKLTTETAGASSLATFIHEIAHEIMHQEANKDKFNNLFIPKAEIIKSAQEMGIEAKDVKEIQAESVAYTVLRTYDYKVTHSPVYLLNWKSNRERINKFRANISETVTFIVKRIESYMKNVEIKDDEEEFSDMKEAKKIMLNFKKRIQNG